MDIFIEISIILTVATGLSIIMKVLRQPLLVGYIITGIFAGPYFLNIIESVDTIELFSKFGITILLFIVGLHLSPAVIKEVGKVSLITGLGQVIFTSAIGFGIALLLGLPTVAAIYTAIALTFSSTIIILKLLSDKGDINKLYGKISVGFLIVQDIVATIILIVVTALGNGDGGNPVLLAGITLIKGIILIAIILFVSHLVLSRILRFTSASQELLFLFSISWGLGLAGMFYALGFSVEIGALVAGVAISSTPYAYEIGSRLKPLRDFFIVLFFILLGSQMVLSSLGELIGPALILSLFVLIGNPIIVVILMNLLGYTRRTGFQAGLTVAQISEFSLILATIGYSIGHLDQEVLSLITLVGLITIAGSTYLILYSDRIFPVVSGFLHLFEWNPNAGVKKDSNRRRYTMLLFGYDRVGSNFLDAFRELKKTFAIVDINPDAIKRLNDAGLQGIYGDAGDVEFLNELELAGIDLCVSTIPGFKDNQLLVEKIREVNKDAIVIVIAHNINESKELYFRGASYVIMSHYLGAEYASQMIKRYGTDRKQYEKQRGKHMKALYSNEKL